ncbi:hypothetical protein OSB04_un001081 [Centaurea solstitialis]|uniref:Uncharacterized protein n=1 Tax=Centaurea solstitialis TaxID=347529 RepID=A0AA38SME2_9ASTR|nr:hypothetical protein OSB04_un001081 [Centaurea solstitialis]
MISGHLPWNLTKFVSLQHLDLHDNNFYRIFPRCSSSKPISSSLVLRNNFFEGFIPTTISNFSNLQILDLTGEKPIGYISLEITNLTIMIEAPVHMSTSVFLHYFAYNGGNQMYFDIEDLCSTFQTTTSRTHSLLSFGNLKGIESLDLSHNKISGSIPKSLEKLDGLGILDVSNNRLTGKIPMGGHMSTMNGLRYFANNSGLCGMQINIHAKGDIPPPLEGREEDEDDENLSWIFWGGTWFGFFPIGFFPSILIIGLLFEFSSAFQSMSLGKSVPENCHKWNHHKAVKKGLVKDVGQEKSIHLLIR